MRPWEYRRRWALVTGASAGLGERFAERLAARGMHLVLSARRRDRLERLAARLREEHAIDTAVIAADLAAPRAGGWLWEQANEGRSIDLLVNNAGFGAQGRFDVVDLERHRSLLRLNCEAPMELAHLAIAAFRGRTEGSQGGIINVASIAAFQPVPLLASYAASKAFLLTLSEALWAENHAAGIRVIALCPGRTPTEFQAVAGTGTAEGAFGFRTPEQVVDAGLAAFEHGRSYVVPGVENLAASWAVRALPRSMVVRAMKRIVRRLWAQPTQSLVGINAEGAEGAEDEAEGKLNR